MKLHPTSLLLLALTLGAGPLHADPRTSSWLTTYATKYARIYTTDANKLAGTASTTWTNGTQVQSSPTYCGIQEISYSTDWVYFRTTGLGAHVMGPWYLDSGHTQTFPNLPKNQKVLYRIPRVPTVPATKTLTTGGVIGYFVDGVAMFDSRDAYYWNGTQDTQAQGTGYWNREAYVNESPSFDPGLAHQENTGTHHYHVNPIALRFVMGDHMSFNTTTKAYSESVAAVTQHSPILGWVKDGYPIYGPYGYGTAMNAASAVRRMVSGYQVRNGTSGTDNLTTAGRNTIPAWAQRAYSVAASQSGPTVSTSYPLGRYMEDNAYLGDLGKTQGVDFDLDEYNGRFCVTPEFPGGTYAYFVSINADGSPKFPYNIGRCYYGGATGGAVTGISDTVTTVFQGEGNKQETMQLPSVNTGTGAVTVVWNATDGGTYQVQASSNLDGSWTNLSGTVTAVGNTAQKVENSALANGSRYYRVTRTALATFDSATNPFAGGILSVSPTSAPIGSTFTLTINLDPSANPAPPPVAAPVNAVTVGTTAGSNRVHVSQTVVTATINLTGATAGAKLVTVTFPGPPENATQTVSYTLTNGFNVTAAIPVVTTTSKKTLKK